MPKKRLHTRYSNLWKDPCLDPSSSPVIDAFCHKLDCKIKLEDYIKELCEGMQELLSSPRLSSQLKEHAEIKRKLKELPRKIIDNSYDDSDLMYLGIFIELELGQRIWDSKFYQIIKGMFVKILDHGHHISHIMRQKLQTLLMSHTPELYHHLFTKKHLLKRSG